DDQRQRDEDCEDREARDLAAEARRDAPDAEVDALAVGRLQVLGQLVLLRRRERPRADLEAPVAVPVRCPAALHDGISVADLGRLVADAADRDEIARLERDLRAALEIDPEVE